MTTCVLQPRAHLCVLQLRAHLDMVAWATRQWVEGSVQGPLSVHLYNQQQLQHTRWPSD